MMYAVDPILKKDGLCKILGECDGAQPIIQMGFKRSSSHCGSRKLERKTT
jgi:hypothetical protein